MSSEQKEHGDPNYSAWVKSSASVRTILAKASKEAELSVFFWWRHNISEIWHDQEVETYEVIGPDNITIIGILLYHPLWQLQLLVQEAHLVDVLMLRSYKLPIHFQEQ